MPQVNIPGVGAVNFPDTMSPEQIQGVIEREILPKKADAPARLGPPQEPTFAEKYVAPLLERVLPSSDVRGSAVGRWAMGAADPVVGTVQTAAHMIPGVDSSAVDKRISDVEKSYQAARGGDAGTDWMRLAGNVTSPANMTVARAIPAATTIPRMIGVGAGVGAVGGAATPVTNEKDQQNFGAVKTAQVGMGAAGGAVLTPIVGKLTGFLGDKVAQWSASRQPVDAAKVDAAISQAAADIGVHPGEFSDTFRQSLRDEIGSALKEGRQLDPAAVARSLDFKALDMKGTLGQVTRDASQFAKERNLRGAPGGEDLLNQFTAQGKNLSDQVAGFGGPQASTTIEAGRAIAAPLAAMDAQAEGKANVLYRGFRELAPDVQVPDPARFSNGLLATLEEKQVGSFLSSDWHKRLNAITNGEFPLTPSTLEQMRQNAAAQLRGAKGSEKVALGSVQNAIDAEMQRLAQTFSAKAAPPGSMVPAGVIAPEVSNSPLLRAAQSLGLGRQQVAARYGLREALPAVEAAADGTVAPDVFVKKFVMDAPTDKVKMLAQALQENSPQAFQEARNQVGADLQRAAFGTNPAGDNAFQPKQYADALRRYGTEKLAVFFSPQEIEKMQTIGRVGAYINSTPNASPVNFSNNSGWALSMLPKALEMLPGGRTTVALGRAVAGVAGKDAAVREAIAGEIPKQAAQMTPEQRALMAKILAAQAFGAGTFAATPFR